MYQSRCSQVNPQCFQHWLHTQTDVFKQWLSDLSSDSSQQHLLLRTVTTTGQVAPVLLPVEVPFFCQRDPQEADCFRLGVMVPSAVMVLILVFVPLTCLSHLR